MALGGASLADERVGAERGQESEAQPNREGVASGSATETLTLLYLCFITHKLLNINVVELFG